MKWNQEPGARSKNRQNQQPRETDELELQSGEKSQTLLSRIAVVQDAELVEPIQ
ncbi:MAG: hypothetical protein P8Y80_14175 [Acidobacteriota bacterium]